MPFQRGSRTSSNDSMPYGAAASASAAMVKEVMVLTFWFSSTRPCFTMSTNDCTRNDTQHSDAGTFIDNLSLIVILQAMFGNET